MRQDFTARVLSVVRRIPPGRVATYGDVAAMAGRPRAARAVGNIMRDCGRPDVPCHRVIAAGGRLGGYGGNETLKRALLPRGRRADQRHQNCTIAGLQDCRRDCGAANEGQSRCRKKLSKEDPLGRPETVNCRVAAIAGWDRLVRSLLQSCNSAILH